LKISKIIRIKKFSGMNKKWEGLRMRLKNLEDQTPITLIITARINSK